MEHAKKIVLRFTVLSGAGLGGWFARKHFERQQYLNDEKDNRASIFSNVNIRNMPCLPIFGTVSAASPIVPAENQADMGAKLSVHGSRISEVSFFFKFCDLTSLFLHYSISPISVYIIK